MRTSNRIPQKDVMRLSDYDVSASHLNLYLRKVNVRPGRTDVPVGETIRFTVPDYVWHDHRVLAVAVGIHHQYLAADDRERQLRAQALEQTRLFDV